MIKYIYNNKLLIFSIHILIGVLATLSFFSKVYTITIIVIGFILIFKSKNKNEEAFLLSFYLVGAEVFIRMTKGAILYETGKYSVILLLLLGLLVEKKKKQTSLFFIFYFLLLLLGIVFTKVPEGESIRKAILFNLSGPFCLGMSAIYFYKRKISYTKLLQALYLGLLPLISMVVYLYFRTPDLKEIVFGGAANFEASGGFGPNQVATAIGVGIFITAIFLVLKKRITGYYWLDFFLLFYFVYRGLLTFSRGGLLSSVIAVLIFAMFFFFSQKNGIKQFSKYILIALVLGSAIWVYTSDATGGMLNNRYTNRNAKGVKKDDITTGRLDIITLQFKNFLDKPMGIGVGNGKYERMNNSSHVTAASHNEVGRLIEEHGFIGFILLIGLISIPLINNFNISYIDKAFLFSFYIFWLLTINHSAMRIAFPGFIYGLSLIKLNKKIF